MAQATKIEWTDVSWNPVHGCSRVSTGCKNCYAETLSLRYGQTTAPWTARNAEQNVMLKPHKLREPLSKAGPWKNPCRVFVNSMSDLFHEQIPDEYICRIFDVMRAAQRHTFQILTKRPERMRDFCTRLRWNGSANEGHGAVWLAAEAGALDGYALMGGLPGCSPLPNVWLGVSIENRKWVGRADVLRQTPAAVRFISAEPLLGPLVTDRHPYECECGYAGQPSPHICCSECGDDWPDCSCPSDLDLTGISWLIVGGESGSGHRPFDPQWARDLRDAAAATAIGVERPDCAFFMKQMGGARPGTALEDLPEDLRIREFPA